MPNTQFEGEVRLFRDTLTKLERLLDVLDNLLSIWPKGRRATEEGIIYLLKVLTELDVNTSESNAIEELERLVVIKTKIQSQKYYYTQEHQYNFNRERVDKMIVAKIEYIRNGSFSRLISKRGVEPIATLERLIRVQRKYDSYDMDDLVESRIKEFVYTPKPEASSRSILLNRGDLTNTLQPFAQSTTAPTVCAAKVVAAQVCASQKQENPKRDPSGESEESKMTAKFVSNQLSWLQYQTQIHTKDDDDSTEDGGQLTPTSTIMFGDPYSTDGEPSRNSTIVSLDPDA